MTIWFTADTHFNHAGIISYCSRPWPTTEEMDAAIIERWNERVLASDTVYHVGDFLFGKHADWHRILDQLKGTIHLIEGNHDRQNVKNKHINSRFASVQSYLEITVPDPEAFQKRQRITLCHYAALGWREQRQGGWMLHGHSHGNLKPALHCPECHTLVIQEVKRLDVGVDCHDYYPISYEQVKAIMNAKPEWVDITKLMALRA